MKVRNESKYVLELTKREIMVLLHAVNVEPDNSEILNTIDCYSHLDSFSIEELQNETHALWEILNKELDK